ncbi:hypothetical protein BJY04DRAFT_137864 [Aspergillus karnatakaensis]|uniref:uncharacterized protein n=1 Tax=Aspergillus karnatakaensis TaxID=1810916 RepID=UPI003CCDD765
MLALLINYTVLSRLQAAGCCAPPRSHLRTCTLIFSLGDKLVYHFLGRPEQFRCILALLLAKKQRRPDINDSNPAPGIEGSMQTCVRARSLQEQESRAMQVHPPVKIFQMLDHRA